MSTPHLSAAEVERFITGRLDRASFRQALRHFLSGCESCRALASPMAGFLFAEAPPAERPAEAIVQVEAIGPSFRAAHAASKRYEEERKKIPGLVATLLSAPRDTMGFPRIFSSGHRLRIGWPLVEALLTASHEMRFQNRRTMLDFAFMARTCAHNLSHTKYPAAFLADLEARAWGELANAHRLNDEFDAAEMAFAEASELLDEGTGDLMVLGRLYDLQASLCSDQRRLSEALELLDQSERCYREAGDDHLVGKVLIQKGLTSVYAGRPREAVPILRDGLSKLSEIDPNLTIWGQHNLLLALVDCGELRAAGELLLQSGLRQAYAEDPINLLRLRWVEGKIFAAQGNLGRAEAILQEVREGFFRQGMVYDSALVGLELASVWLEKGKTAEVRGLAEEACETFEDLAVPREALRAIRYFQQACRREEVTAVLVQRIVLFLRRLEWEPQLRFAP